MVLCHYHKQQEELSMDLQTLFWNADIDDLTKGYLPYGPGYICLICGEIVDKDQVYPVSGQYYTAKKMIEHHIKEVHGSMFHHMLTLNKTYTSLSDNQNQVLSLMSQGLADKEIAKSLSITESTIRNYRFKFKEKEKQAKVFLSMMTHLKNQDSMPVDQLITPHKGATQLDDRYNITEKDVKNTLAHHMNESGGLINFPAKEKKKIIVLREIAKNFTEGKFYSEKEINRLLERIYDDYALIRRYLIQYGFLDRHTDGKGYWVK